MSQAEWKEFMGVNPSRKKGDTLPVETISWEDCQEFCKKTGLSLPTEAQWEYACRAGTSGPFAGTGKLDDMGWYAMNSGDTTHRVGEKTPNDFGLHDMHGNVWEWCEDWYQADYYDESTGANNTLCENSGSGSRSARGGSFYNRAGYCRSAFRVGVSPGIRNVQFGFRPAWSSP